MCVPEKVKLCQLDIVKLVAVLDESHHEWINFLATRKLGPVNPIQSTFVGFSLNQKSCLYSHGSINVVFEFVDLLKSFQDKIPMKHQCCLNIN